MTVSTARAWFFIGLGLLACSSSDTGGGGERSLETVAQTTSALAASTTLDQAVAGKIQSIVGAPGNVISAGIDGRASVGHDGSANYRIPLWVPEGINDLEPELAVEYNSEGGQGILGPRWSLTGLSVITRCPKTRAKDGVQTGVDFMGNSFCLDGQPMVLLSSNYVEGEFRTERNSFRKILGTRLLNDNYKSFKVYQPDGRIYYYGTASSWGSRLHGNPLRFSGGTSEDVAYAYLLNRIEDRYGNAIEITYKNVNSTNTGKTEVQELVPETIKWGTGQLRSVTFSYESLPAGVTVNPQKRYIAGLAIGQGQYLERMTIRGPTGATSTSTAVLKVYKFGYDTKSKPNGPDVITRRRVLTSISECDANDVCKKPTSIEWEAGTTAYTRRPFNIPNFHAPVQTGYHFPHNDYAKFLLADLNADGRDDIIYRAYVSPHHSDGQDCLGWRVSLAVPDSAGMPTYAEGVPLPLGGDPDWTCHAFVVGPTYYRNAAGGDPNMTGGIAYKGDLLFSDLDNDGYTDILSPISRTISDPVNYAPEVWGYRAYLNKTRSLGVLGFGPPTNLLHSAYYQVRVNHIALQVPNQLPVQPIFKGAVAIGDIDGNGFPDILQPYTPNPVSTWTTQVTPNSLSAVLFDTYNGWSFPFQTISNQATVPPATFSNGTRDYDHITTLDMDGDGKAEVLREMLSATYPGEATVTSPTMNGRIAFRLGSHSQTILDLNGDGLEDIAAPNAWELYRGLGIKISTGQGFTETTSISWHNCSADAKSGRVIDFNSDGRMDLLVKGWLLPNLPADVANQRCLTPENPTRIDKWWVLESNGLGGFTVRDPGVPNMPAPPPPAVTPLTLSVGDLNGDGMADLVQEENDQPVAYIRQGKLPEHVTAVHEGSGVRLAFTYDSANESSEAYTVTAFETCGKDPQRLECLVRGRWLTTALSVTADDNELTQRFTYDGGVSDKHGRGFLGFRQREITGPGTRRTVIKYDPVTKTQLSNLGGYVYREFLPSSITTEADTDDAHPHRTETYTYVRPILDGFNKTYVVSLGQVVYSRYDCPAVVAGTCPANTARRSLGSQSEDLTYDSYGNITQQVTTWRSPQGSPIQIDTERNFFRQDLGKWLISLPHLTEPNTFTSASTSPAESVTRTVKLTANGTTGALSIVEIEPGADENTHLKRTFGFNPKGQVTTITDEDFEGTPMRRTTLDYDSADGVYVWKVTDPIGNFTRTWRHPGLGLVVETDDENGLAATATFDTFGRPLSKTGTSGKSKVMVYYDGAGSGSDVGIYPDGVSGRLDRIHLDPFFRETSREVHVGSGRQLRSTTSYDERGRVDYKRESSVVGSASPTILAEEVFWYDDLDRVTCSGRTSSDGFLYYRSKIYDGLYTTTTDEAGRVTTRIDDGMGRRVTQRADGVADATFKYGAFSLLREEKAGVGPGQTDLGYDVLGRLTSVGRTDAGIRRSAYNAFGDLFATWKSASDGTFTDMVYFGRDVLGRLTSVTGSGLDRRFYWDAPASAPTTPAPNGKGKLIDVTDSTSTRVHFDYDSNGLLSKKTWYAAVWGPLAEIGSASYGYDPQGRLTSLTYPKLGIWSNPLVVTYGYDAVTGRVSSIRDAANPSTPLWAVSAWGERGEVAGESMRMPGGPLIDRSSTYYRGPGLLQAATLSSTGASGTAFQTINYAYDRGGLPSQIQQYGHGISGIWNSTLTHDHLGRLTRWGSGTCCGGFEVGVSYGYDADGNMTSRSWGSPGGGGSLAYGITQGTGGAYTRTVTFNGFGPPYTDNYQADRWGRIFDTPAIALTYNAADEVTAITEKANGQADYFYRDGFGKRLVTTYGNPFNGQPWAQLFTFEDLAEIRNGSAGVEERIRLRANGKLIGEVVRTSNTTTRTATFFLTDAVGSVVAEASSTGTITPRARRDPYGNLVSSPTSPDLPREPVSANQDGSGRLAFGDRPRDNNWGLVDMNARFYSPRLGRFISPDPLISNVFERRAHNPFAYAWNSPAAMNDPSGLEGNDPDPPPPLDPPSGDSNWEGFKNFVKDVGEGAGDAAEGAVDGVVDAWDYLFGSPTVPVPIRVFAPDKLAFAPRTSAYGGDTTGRSTGGTTETNRPGQAEGNKRKPNPHFPVLPEFPRFEMPFDEATTKEFLGDAVDELRSLGLHNALARTAQNLARGKWDFSEHTTRATFTVAPGITLTAGQFTSYLAGYAAMARFGEWGVATSSNAGQADNMLEYTIGKITGQGGKKTFFDPEIDQLLIRWGAKQAAIDYNLPCSFCGKGFP